MTACQELVELWIFPPVQLVDGKFPHWVRLAGAVLVITRTLVWPPVVKCVGPYRNSGKRNCYRCIVGKELVCHHRELVISSNQEVWSPDTNHSPVCDIGELLNDEPVPGHLGQPGLVVPLSPVVWILLTTNRENSNLVSSSV